MNLENKPLSLAKTKSFILAYLQQQRIIYATVWGSPYWTKTGIRSLPGNDVRALWQLEKEGYAEKAEPELPIWIKYPHTKGHTTYHHSTGYVYKLTETGRAKSLKKNLTQTSEYQDWLIDHLKDDKAYQSALQKIEQRAEELQKMPCQEYLQTDEWKAVRAIIIERAHKRCERCGEWDDYTLHVHHKIYSHRG